MYREDYRYLKSVNCIWAGMLFLGEFTRFDIDHSMRGFVVGQFINIVALSVASVALKAIYTTRRLD